MKSQKNEKIKSSAVYFSLLKFAIGYVATIYIFREYNNFTIIEFKFLLLVFLLTGVLAGYISHTVNKKANQPKPDILRYYGSTILAYGIVCCALFLYSNKILSNEKEYNLVAGITAIHEGYRRSPNHIVTDIKGVERQINIHDYTFEEMQRFNFVHLTMKNGFWGFPIILKVKLVRG